MDPLSIVLAIGTLCTTCSAVTLQLRKISQDTTNVDRSVTELQSEVDAIKKSFELVNKVVDSDLVVKAEKRATREERDELWSSVHGILSDCGTTLTRLEQSFEDFVPKGANRLRQCIRSVRLNMKQDDIRGVRSQLKTHSSALQIVLQMVNLRATRLCGKVVEDKLDELKMLVKKGVRDRIETTSANTSVQVKRLHDSAMREISSAATVSSSSEDGASVVGEALSERKSTGIKLWIPDPAQDNSHLLRASPSSSISSRLDPFDFSKTGTPDTDMTNFDFEDEMIYESEDVDDIEAETVDALMIRGAALYDAGCFDEAQKPLKAALQKTQQLSPKRRDVSKMTDMKVMLATCSYQLENLDEAAARLYAITQMLATDDEDKHTAAIRRFQVTHLLAEVLLLKGCLKAALSFCLKAIGGRKRILGETDSLYYESLHLASQIYRELGSPFEAAVFHDRIPLSVADKLIPVRDKFAASRPEELGVHSSRESDQGLIVHEMSNPTMTETKLLELLGSDPDYSNLPPEYDSATMSRQSGHDVKTASILPRNAAASSDSPNHPRRLRSVAELPGPEVDESSRYNPTGASDVSEGRTRDSPQQSAGMSLKNYSYEGLSEISPIGSVGQMRGSPISPPGHIGVLGPSLLSPIGNADQTIRRPQIPYSTEKEVCIPFPRPEPDADQTASSNSAISPQRSSAPGSDKAPISRADSSPSKSWIRMSILPRSRSFSSLFTQRRRKRSRTHTGSTRPPTILEDLPISLIQGTLINSEDNGGWS